MDIDADTLIHFNDIDFTEDLNGAQVIFGYCSMARQRAP